jgi:hypothetical protein
MNTISQNILDQVFWSVALGLQRLPFAQPQRIGALSAPLSLVKGAAKDWFAPWQAARSPDLGAIALTLPPVD